MRLQWMKRFFSQYWKEMVTGLILFVLALGVRLLYQKESIVDTPVRADAARYVAAALNLCRYSVYSDEMSPWEGIPPESRTDLSPGYPLFLSLFIGQGANLEAVLRTQAIMGAITTVLTFLLARMSLGLSWAILAGILTALSPHLIAMDGYLLTESLFTFVMMLGTAILAISWRRNWFLLTFVAGILLAFSAHIRAVNFLFLFFILPVFFFDPSKRSSLPRKVWIKHLLSLLTGFVFVTAAYYEFVNLTGAKNAIFSNPVNEEIKTKPSEEYVSLRRAWTSIKENLTPLRFYVMGESHIYIYHGSFDYRQEIKEGFWARPLSYIGWNLWGKQVVLWHWDDLYNGDVYIYPMIREGFEENKFLKAIHRSMRLTHTPLFMAALLSLILFGFKWRRANVALDERLLLIPVLGFLYFLILLPLLSWAPRYTIPARPFSYILASASISWIYYWGRQYFPGGNKAP